MKNSFYFPEEFRLYAPWEKAVDRLLTPLEEFIRSQTASALILLFMTVVALVMANSPLGKAYHHFFEQELALRFGSGEISMSLHHWINEGLMTFFFFLIGLEIKREILVGELSNPRAALLPVVAAVGGMVLPALLYALVNHGKPTLNGWGIPMATDIAFAISVLVLLRRHIPRGLITFLIALAIVDDLGAVLVIALFYTQTLNLKALAGAMAVWGLLWIFNRAGLYRSGLYLAGGVVLWWFMLSSGVHATLAGVLTALAVPSRPKLIPRYFKDVLQKLLRACEDRPTYPHYTLTPGQKEVIQAIHAAVESVQPPSLKMEHALHLPVALGIIPLFALANAGLHLEIQKILGIFHHPVSLGIVLGLVIGKVTGISGTAWLLNRLGIAPLPRGVRTPHLIGVGFLAGIGFTMCIFMAELSFPGEKILLEQAKMGILLASLLAGLIGYLWLRYLASPEK
ncbi:Na+/H+ antiporter NhaA [Thermosulfurimonas sp.]|uniref:Na+/H+ antiporter NhaA n=1 Tax=Thermosulfurimonas sp. TaxID=2080236 RepID=UPI0025DD181F|nr:Na+/H+ antiporter NhaA [Thermosulfurimonas sp.]